MQALVGQYLGRYHIVEQLGEGGMASVYKAFDTRLERTVAVKVIRTDMILPSMLNSMLKRFEREAMVLAQLSHPNIVNIYDYGEHHGAPYLVMEYLAGGTLKQYTGKAMPFEQAARFLLPVARALEYAHEMKVIHRDVKPANILISALNEVKLSDFGIAKVLEDEQATQITGTGVGIGTPEYMAPEQCLGKVLEQTDQYALGVVFYELITGRKPYLADTPVAVLLKQMNEQLPRPQQFVPNLPEAVEQVLFKALAKRPEDRYPNMGAFAQALDKLTERDAFTLSYEQKENPTFVGTEKSQGSDEPVGSHPRSKLWMIMLIVMALLVGCTMMTGFLGFWLYGNRSTANLTQTAPGVALLATSVPAVMDTWTAAPPEPTAVPATETVTLQPSPMPFSSLTPGSGATQIAGIDEMVLVFVPEGVFPMGAADQDQQAEVFEKPEHIVFLDSFWIDRIEVTNAMFSRFVNATGYVTEAETGAGWIWNGSDWEKTASADWRHPRGEGSSILGKENFPVVQVTWDDAEAYCQWAGRRLPTEAEWEKAARGSDGRSYPWGSEAPNTQLLNYNDHIGDTTSAGSYPRAASPYGALDMAGNVWEWVADWYDPEYYGNSPPENPPGPGSGVDRVMRGGSWHYNDPLIRTTYRGHIYPDYAGDSLGFRCAMSP